MEDISAMSSMGKSRLRFEPKVLRELRFMFNEFNGIVDIFSGFRLASISMSKDASSNMLNLKST